MNADMNPDINTILTELMDNIDLTLSAIRQTNYGDATFYILQCRTIGNKLSNKINGLEGKQESSNPQIRKSYNFYRNDRI